jgi:uncharacterized protein YbjT (DUF2867 family)
MKVRAIITGVTGMVGEGVLMEALKSPDVEQVLIVNRKPSGFVHAKLKELVIKDFFDLTSIEAQLSGYNACFFNLGVSSVGMKEPEYNKDMIFTYISGAGTDGSEKGRTMWARVKGKTENDLMKLPFKRAYAFRPGFMRPEAGSKNVLPAYKYVGWLFPLVRAIYPAGACELSEVGIAMINAVTKGYDKQVLEVKDIVALSKK